MAVAGAAALAVREEQVRTRVAFRQLAADRRARRQDAAPRWNAGVVLLLAGPAIDAPRAVQVIEPRRVHGAPPVTWVLRPRRIQLPFNRLQERGEPWLAFGQQLAHVCLVVPGPVVPSLNVSAHKDHPALTLPFSAHAALGSAGCRPEGMAGAASTRIPASSKSTTPLQRRFQPCPGWLATTRAAARSRVHAPGHRGRCSQARSYRM